MSFGLSVTNVNNEVIISESTKNLHFLGKGIYSGYTLENTAINGYSGSFARLDGSFYITYNLPVPINFPVNPIVFIRLKGYRQARACVFKTSRVYEGSYINYRIVVLMTGILGPNTSWIDESKLPEVYCFDQADYCPVNDYGLVHGLQVYESDGDKVNFDSRRLPLAIIGGGEHVPPYDPTNGDGLPGVTQNHPWRSATNDHDFRSTLRKNSYQVDVGDTPIENLMFATSTIAQACWLREIQGYKNSTGSFFSSSQQHWSWARWWVMYRNCCGLSSGSGNNIFFDSGWGPVASGFSYEERFESGGWFGGGGGSYATGSAPYEQKTLNLRNTMFLLADATRYE
jgi:hypothetical protein